MQFGVENNTDVLQPEAFFHSLFADTQPGDISLSDMHDTLSIVNQMVNLPFQNRFVIGFIIAAGNFNLDCQR